MAGFRLYLRFIFRRERIVSGLWLVILCAFVFLIAAVFPSVFGEPEAVRSMSAMLSSPAMTGLMGPSAPAESTSIATMFSQSMLVWLMLAVGVMNIFLVIRHTRADEELGRLETLRGLPVGRLTGAGAALFFAVLLDFAISLVLAGLLVLANMPGASTAGAFVFSFAIGAVGVFFAAAALLSAQIFTTSRAAVAGAFAVLGLSYLIRASGDAGGNELSLFSPMGLGLRAFPFYKNEAWTLPVILAGALILAALAFLLGARRDLGTGLIPAWAGRSRAGRYLGTPFGLAFRLSRNTALVWCLALFIFGGMYGAVMGNLDGFVASSDTFKQLLEAGQGAAVIRSVAERYVSFLFAIISIFSTIPILNLAGRLRGEEKRGYLEPVLANSVARAKYFGAFIAIAALESVAVTLLAALGIYLPTQGAGVVSLGTTLAAALCYLPAIWVLMGVCVFLTGLAPRLSVLSWAVFAYSFAVTYFGRMFNVPEALRRIAPYGNVPQLPVQDFRPLPLVVLTLIAAALTAAGLWGFTRRDLE